MSTCPTSQRRSCDCEKCRSLCGGSPGWFLPGEAEAAAESLGLNYESFVLRYCIVEYWVGCPDIFVLAPRRLGQRFKKAEWGDAFRRASCSLLGEKGCMLDAERRPNECATCFGCEKTEGNPREAIQEAWNTPELQEHLETLLDKHT